MQNTTAISSRTCLSFKSSVSYLFTDGLVLRVQFSLRRDAKMQRGYPAVRVGPRRLFGGDVVVCGAWEYFIWFWRGLFTWGASLVDVASVVVLHDRVGVTDVEYLGEMDNGVFLGGIMM